jgi:D-alanyl-D-alanine carboxypeptidase
VQVATGPFGSGGKLESQYGWLQQHAAEYGFEQTYTADSAAGRPGYTEERWHWSYVPAAQALQEWAASPAGAQATQRELNDAWGTQPQYSYLRQHYQEYMQNTNPNGPLTGC